MFCCFRPPKLHLPLPATWSSLTCRQIHLGYSAGFHLSRDIYIFRDESWISESLPHRMKASKCAVIRGTLGVLPCLSTTSPVSSEKQEETNAPLSPQAAPGKPPVSPHSARMGLGGTRSQDCTCPGKNRYKEWAVEGFQSRGPQPFYTKEPLASGKANEFLLRIMVLNV